MGIDGGIRHGYPFRHLDAVGREIPDSLDAGSDGYVSRFLGTLRRDGEDAYRGRVAFHDVINPVYMIDGNPEVLPAYYFRSDIESGDDFQSVIVKTGVSDQGFAKASASDHICFMHFCEAEKFRESAAERSDFIADPGLSF